MGRLPDLTIPAWLAAALVSAALGLALGWTLGQPDPAGTPTASSGLYVSPDGARWTRIDNSRLYYLCVPDTPLPNAMVSAPAVPPGKEEEAHDVP